MDSKTNNVRFEKIFLAWLDLEKEDITEVEQELLRLKEVCANRAATITTLRGSFLSLYNSYFSQEQLNIPIIKKFFLAVKNVSDEAYSFLTEGHDILDLKNYLEFSNERKDEIIQSVLQMKQYSLYIYHAFMKILYEKDTYKKKVMLKGLVGI